MTTLSKLLKPLASLRITVALLFISCVLVLAGTTAQRDMGIQDVQHQFFHSWVARIQLHYFQPAPKAGNSYIGGWFLLPGGFSLIILLLINLLAAHTVRFKFNRKRIGIILIHLGLIMLLAGEWVTAHHAVESQMPINVGSSANFAQDIREAELAATDPSPADHDNVIVVGESALQRSARDGHAIHDPKLPFDVKVERWYDNVNLRGPMEQGAGIERLANAGSFQKFALEGISKFSGTESERVDMPSAFVSFSKNGQPLGTYALSTYFENDKPQELNVDGKTYLLSLRFKRYYKPYTVTLKKFTHELFPGTDMPRDFASEIRLVDPARHVDREVKIWMNNPLRYNGETFYQQSFANNDRTSILQIVHNPGWLMPYLACSIGALGLVIHFGTNLIVFLRRKFAANNQAVTASSRQGSRNSARPSRANGGESYTLKPQPTWAIFGIPAAVLAFAVLFVVSRTMPPSRSADGFDWEAFGRLPIQFEGRVQPIDSWARNSLNIVSGHQFVRDDKGEYLPNVSPSQWLLETISGTGKWAEYKIIRIDHPDIKQMLGLKVTEKDFSWNELFKDPNNFKKLDEQARLASEVPDKQRDAYQSQMIELHQRLGIFIRVQQVNDAEFEYSMGSRESVPQLVSAIETVDPQFRQRVQSLDETGFKQAISEDLAKLDVDKLTTEQRSAVGAFMNRDERIKVNQRLMGIPPDQKLFLAAPLRSGDKWAAISDAALLGPQQMPQSAAMFLNIVSDFASSRAGDFNGDVAKYQAQLQSAIPDDMSKVDYESFVNRFDPFLICTIFYVTILLLALASWVFWTTPLKRTAYWLLVFTFLVHTFGLISRIYISGRPPVTNLYGASVFIGWGIAFFCIALEFIFRNTIAMVTGATAGCLTMLVAAGLSSVEGDTMKQLQAVLDTNAWLATHVVCVTLGYIATYLAGLLAIVYILRGILSSSLTKEESKDNAKMVYGILCFAMLFSFVGTILGGIWADQSWGRFWGWDPKENGAVLVVLWNALILHARWGGLVKERGVMVLAILGNIVTSWSFFGTNMLGIGLHSYGFMQSAQFWLVAFCLSQLALAAIGAFTPIRLWASFAENQPKTPRVAATV
jgi:ABC-type transport system involved in cytochrome c biogenesis permease subunit